MRMIWYCDSSALLKRYVRETGSLWFRQQLSSHRIIASVLAIAELPAALGRRKRQGTLSVFEFHRNRTQFNNHLQSRHYLLLQAFREIVDQAALLTYRHPLAAYDAVQLSTALEYLKNSGINAKQFYFVTADDQLQRAAESEGLQTENPNDHT